MSENTVGRIGVIGPGIVGMPMAALLARACQRGQLGPDAHVVVVQRDSPTSGWKVLAINAGRSPVGGIEPGLEDIIASAVADERLRATHDFTELATADLILVCIQTDKEGLAPDYGPMTGGLEALAAALARKPAGHKPIVVFESTLAPSSMATYVRELFARHGLLEGRDVLLGNSPNRVMPGRLVERVAQADKLVAGLSAETPPRVAALYRSIVPEGTLHLTNSLTAEVVKTLENCYRDVRIAYAAEVVRFCDARDVDFYALREQVNARAGGLDAASYDSAAIPKGAMLVPALGVGGHCLPKDGILLRWRVNQHDPDGPAGSLIHAARDINDASPRAAVALAERHFGPLAGRPVAILGLSYRFDSDDTRNSPAFQLADVLRELGCPFRVHDPYVRPTDANVERERLRAALTDDLDLALRDAEIVFVGQGHKPYREAGAELFAGHAALRGVVDAANVWKAGTFDGAPFGYCGVGRGTKALDAALIDAIAAGFALVERGFANELAAILDFLNARYAADAFNRVDMDVVRRLGATCVTGCDVVEPGPPTPNVGFPDGFASELVRRAQASH